MWDTLQKKKNLPTALVIGLIFSVYLFLPNAYKAYFGKKHKWS